MVKQNSTKRIRHKNTDSDEKGEKVQKKDKDDKSAPETRPEGYSEESAYEAPDTHQEGYSAYEETPASPEGCHGLSGEMLKDGDTRQLGCNVCTCNGKSGNLECVPYQCNETIVCAENERKVFGDPTKQSGASCCGYCEPQICKHNGTEYKINDSFRDPENPCLVYTCDVTGLTAWADRCLKQKYCTKDRRTYDEFGCCYTCDTSCKPTPASMELSIMYSDLKDKVLLKCSAFVEMAKCNGECKDSLRYDTDQHKVINDCFCCREQTSETRNIILTCNDKSKKIYPYKHITSCKCNACYTK
ncbi:integumentary mucin B.1-like [Mixophyes fleayi]|uniref:integumentary mucin B.1-like n=1 Tax=Mixophyes fleayi TaxID=3061075 RepID=UPI003F4E0CB4